MGCEAQRQGDEMFCAHCDMRWDHGGDPVQCGKTANLRARRRAGQLDEAAPEPTERDIARLKVAKAINGPQNDRHIGREMMLRLRDHKWANQTTKAERQGFLNAAEAALREIET